MQIALCAVPTPALARPASVSPRSRQLAASRRRPVVRVKAEKGHNGSSTTHGAHTQPTSSPEEQHVAQMVNLVNQYFDEFMSNGKMEVAVKVLESHAEHKDMVRDLGYNGVKEIQEYVAQLKRDYPNLWVKATQFGVANPTSMFVAFEGKADDRLPLFKGVDLFCFNQHATKIKEIQVYRSNWMGAKGHEERKKAAQAAR